MNSRDVLWTQSMSDSYERSAEGVSASAVQHGSDSLSADERAALSRLQEAEDSIRRAYMPSDDAPPVVSPVPAAGVDAASSRFSASRFRIGLTGVAAALALVFVGQQLLSSRSQVLPVDAGAVHARFVSNPIPTIVCDTPEKFLAYTTDKVGLPIGVVMEPEVTLIGWRVVGGYEQDAAEGEPSPRLLLATGPQDEPIVVVFQDSDAPQPVLTDGQPLAMHSRSFDGIVAWEITPLDRPVVLGTLTDPE